MTTAALSDAITVFAGTRFGEPESFAEFEARVERQLRALGLVHPAFRQLAIIDNDNYEPIDTGLGNLSARLRLACARGGEESDLVGAGAGGELLPTTQNLIGFSVTFRAGVPAETRSSPQSIHLRFHGLPIGREPTSSNSIELPAVAPWTELAFARALLATMIETGNGNAGSVVRMNFRRRQRQDLGDRSEVDWLTYVARPAVLGCLPPDIVREPFANGELVVLTPHLPDPASSADLHAARKLRDALGEFGLLEWGTYVIHGWPPDEEESRYEQLISGAPQGRKYVVNCVEFDGYDSDRKVLLYAKLFRELKVAPKGWGLRGIDKPVLNEAQRQVRAAAKAGNMPIEWHIALEEPARRAAELLAEFGSISPRQIQVFHSPIDMIRPAEGARP